MQVKKQQLELDMEQQTGSKLGKEYVKAVYCHPDYSLPYMQSTSCEMSAMHKILQARIQQYVNRELPDVQARFRKGRGTRDQIANIH